MPSLSMRVLISDIYSLRLLTLGIECLECKIELQAREATTSRFFRTIPHPT
jgi:hypothetical protein